MMTVRAAVSALVAAATLAVCIGQVRMVRASMIGEWCTLVRGK